MTIVNRILKALGLLSKDKIKLKSREELAYTIISATAKANKINNDFWIQPNRKAILKRLQDLDAHIIQPIKDRFEHHGSTIQINSVYRCPELNAKIGSMSYSQHCRGEAVDLELLRCRYENQPNTTTTWYKDLGSLVKFIEKNLDFDQLIVEGRGGSSSKWVHVSYVKNRKDSFKMNLAKRLRVGG